MSKTAKLCAIFFISTVWLVAMRILFGFLNLSDNVSGWLFSFLVQVVGMGVIPITLFKFWVEEDVISGFSLKVKLPPVTYVLAIVLGFLVSYLNTGISVIWQSMLRLIGYTHVNSVGTIYSDAGVLVMELITTALLPGIFEEITDRGLVLRMFKGIENEKLVIFLTAMLFGLAHQNVVQTGYTFVGGLIFAYLALKTKSILPGMIIHFINNALTVISGYSSQHSGFYTIAENALYSFINNHFILAVISWVVVGFIIFSILKYIARVQPKEEIPEEDGEVFFFPSKLQYVDELFGSGLKRDVAKPAVAKRSSWYEYAFLYGSVVVTVLTTLFTFMWGVWR